MYNLLLLQELYQSFMSTFSTMKEEINRDWEKLQQDFKTLQENEELVLGYTPFYVDTKNSVRMNNSKKIKKSSRMF